MKFIPLVVLCMAAGCWPSLPIENRPCPCVIGYSCDTAHDRCVLDGTPLPDGSVSDGPVAFWTSQAISAPISQNLSNIWGSGPSDIYVNGSNGGFFHSTGNGIWTRIQNAAALDRNYNGIWGSAATDIYTLVADGFGENAAILHSTGNGTWAQVAVPTEMLDIWGSASNDVWAVGVYGTILHSAGGNVWEQSASPATSHLESVWGTSNVNAYAVGWGGTILRWDGMRWSIEISGGSRIFAAVFGTSASDVYAVATDGTLLHSIGDGNWTDQTFTSFAGGADLWASSSRDVYLVSAGGSEFDGIVFHSTGDGTWVQIDPGARFVPGPAPILRAVWGMAADDIYFVDGIGRIFHLP